MLYNEEEHIRYQTEPTRLECLNAQDRRKYAYIIYPKLGISKRPSLERCPGRAARELTVGDE